MALSSMTGFARADGAHGAVSWYWEVRTVNARGLDLRLRLPPGYEGLEPKVREATAKRIQRGSVAISLAARRETAQLAIRLNEAALAQVVAAAERVRTIIGGEPPGAETLLRIAGVLEVGEPVESEDVASERTAAMLASLEAALDGLAEARRSEGRRLGAVLSEQLAEIARLVARIEASPARRPEAVAQRLREQVARVLDSGLALDPARLHQEAVLVATRADVEEELKRLTSHVTAAHELLASSEPVGRRLDFLAQEFNREANTLCSKSNDTEITRMGLALKAVIDQMREQVQNIE